MPNAGSTQRIYQVLLHLHGGGVVTIEHASMDGASGTMLHFKRVLTVPRSERAGCFVVDSAATVMSPAGVGAVPVAIVPHAEVAAAKLLVVDRPSLVERILE